MASHPKFQQYNRLGYPSAIQVRPYRTVDDLLKVKGIGEKRLAQIRPLVTER